MTRNQIITKIAAAGLTLFIASTALAQMAPTQGFRAEFLGQLAADEKKVVSLAEAMPADKYAWRPGDGVRSVSEVFLHIAGANFGIPRFYGTPPPEGFNGGGYDKHTTDKAQIVAALKESFAHLHKAALNISDADENKAVKMFGRETTYRGALMMTIAHLSEHLGQSIAYARTNGVVPPWSE